MASDPKPPSIGESLSAQPSRTIFISKDLRDPLHVLRCGLAAYMPKGSLPTYSDLFLLLIEAAPHLVERLFVGAAIAGDNADVAISNARENLAQLVRKARRVSTPLTQAHPPAGQSTVFHPGQFQSFPGQLPGSSSRSNPYFNFVPGQVPGSSNSNPYFNFTRGQVPGSSNSSNPYFNFMPGQVPGNSNSNPYYNVAPGVQQKAALRRGRASRRKKTGASIEDDESDGYQPVTFRLPNVLEIMAVDPAAVDGLDFSKSKIESSSKFGWGGPRRGCNYEELAARASSVLFFLHLFTEFFSTLIRMPAKDPPGSPTKSRSITKTVNGSHQFNITGYSLAKGMGVGKYMSSDTFTVGGFKWAIYFYPDGKNAEDNSQYVSLFIALASEGTDVRALFELTMLDQSGRGRHKVHSHFDRALESGPYTLKYRGSMWGYKRFFRRATLETSDYLKDDTLQITCTVGVVVTETEGPKQPVSIPIPPSQMGKDYEVLLYSGEGCDVTFDVGDETVSAHRVILAARSPVLKALLYGPMRDRREGNIPVTDIEAPVFKALLHFIYTDDLPSSGPSAFTPIMAQHLLAAADRYALDRLRLICESKLCETVDADTVATTLALAEQHNAKRLKNVCLQFAAQNLATLITLFPVSSLSVAIQV
ncbi:unnamed protein product [Closterium sp. NIES-64]|nr:unnamed protein product [Closterium sp. NIES-64]